MPFLGLFYQPEGAVLLGLIIFAVIVLATRNRRATVATDGPPVALRRAVLVRRMALAGSLAVLVTYVAVSSVSILHLLSRYFARQFLPMFGAVTDVRWWVFALPVVAAIVCFTVLIVLLPREDSKQEAPVAPVRARGWLTFSRKREWVTGGVVVSLLVLTCVVAGAASSPDDDGWYSLIEIPVGDLDSGAATFFGWAHGVPVLITTALLTTLLVAILSLNSRRPYMRPETVEAESAARRATAKTVVLLYIASLLLPLGGAWSMTGYAGLGSVGVGIPGVGEFMYSTGYAAIAPLIVTAGGVAQVSAVVLLLLTARAGMTPRRRASVPVATPSAA